MERKRKRDQNHCDLFMRIFIGGFTAHGSAMTFEKLALSN
jgi:NAD/NADP transhydrogenase beta subunit